MKCPGQDPRFWKFDAIFDAECPKCGSKLEFFKDETRRTCKKCGHKVLNPKMDFGCATHCKFAADCFG
ncbi:MAG: phosphohydrolase, partial [Pseudomonadota bacterium]